MRNQKGQSLVEYMIIVSIMAVGALAAVRTLSHTVQYKFSKVAEAMGAKPNSSLDRPEIAASASSRKDMRNFMQGALSGSKNNSQESEGD